MYAFSNSSPYVPINDLPKKTCASIGENVVQKPSAITRFMKRVIADGFWTTFSPIDAQVFLGKSLIGTYGDEFENAYIACESNLQNTKTFKARELFFKIIKMQCTTGEPFLFFIDQIG